MPPERIPTPDFAKMTIAELIEDIEHAGFSCEASNLRMFIPWRELKARLVMPEPIAPDA